MVSLTHSSHKEAEGRGKREAETILLPQLSLTLCASTIAHSHTHSHIDIMWTGTAGDRLTHRKVITTVSHEESHRKPGGQRPGDPLPSYLQNRTAGRPGPSPEGSRNLSSGPPPGLNRWNPASAGPERGDSASGGHKGARAQCSRGPLGNVVLTRRSLGALEFNCPGSLYHHLFCPSFCQADLSLDLKEEPGRLDRFLSALRLGPPQRLRRASP